MYKGLSEVSVGSVGKKQKLFFCEQKDTESPKSLCKNLCLQVFGNNNRTMQFLKYFFTLIIDVNNYVVEMTHTLAGYLCIHG